MLKIRYSPHTFIRHCNGESLIWHRQNYAAFILKDAEPFLNSISRDYRDVDSIVVNLASFFEADKDEIIRMANRPITIIFFFILIPFYCFRSFLGRMVVYCKQENKHCKEQNGRKCIKLRLDSFPKLCIKHG